MKHILAILFVVAIFASAFMIGPSLINPSGFVVVDTEENKQEDLLSFRTYTKAICDNVSGFVVCHDELFVSCGGFDYRLPKNEVNGKGIFDKDWEDPRNG